MLIWDGIFPRSETDRLIKLYFTTDYDPHQDFNSAVKAYLKRYKKGHSFEHSLSFTKKELKIARFSGEITAPIVATTLAVWQVRNPSLAPHMPLQGQIRRASRESLKKLQNYGRAREYWKIALYRRLGNSYYLGTGKKPYIAGRGKYRGTPYRYFCDVINVIQKQHGNLGLSPNTRFAVKQFSDFNEYDIA